jgi:Transcriptional regulators
MTKYEQIKQELLTLIEDIPPHQQIPGERVLEMAMNAARMTVRKAIDALVNEGHLYRKEGIGTFVADRLTSLYFNQTTFLADAFNPLLSATSTKVLSLHSIVIKARLAKALDLPIGTKVSHMRRVRYVHHLPVVYDESYYIEAITGPLSLAIVEKSTLDYLEQDKGVQIHSAYYDFRAILADESLQLVLSTEALEPVMKILRRTYSNKGEIIDVTQSYIRTNHYDLLIKAKVDE